MKREYKGVVYDYLETSNQQIIRDQTELESLKPLITTQRPRFVPGRMKVDGWETVPDAIVDGNVEIDFSSEMMLFVIGVKIQSITEENGRMTVGTEFESDNRYHAVVVSISEDVIFEEPEGNMVIESRPTQMGSMPMFLQQ
eukprot:TRINITY_DN3673_c0_g1_i1.p1 TRINITY_DN3673_c0_g1~~TRINITY_DN3673_c0_g1_i1.p1  ORF type:complete len:141 (-),score=37.80 TRINITY_DN3673_c0_g1_i1:28-450(-)